MNSIMDLKIIKVILFLYSNCQDVVIPKVNGTGPDQLKKDDHDKYCFRCECKYENRNTTIIKVSLFLRILFS